MDEITSKWANPTLRITTRECFQFHGIGKKNLKELVNTLNKNLNDKKMEFFFAPLLKVYDYLY